MLEVGAATAGLREYQQSFEVRYDYPVYFTRDVFDPHNPCLMTALARREPDKLHRVAVFVDDGVALTYPTLEERIVRYAERHAGSMQIVDSVVVVPGGEVIKHRRDCVEQILKDLSSRHIDRQSCSLAIGGGAMLDAVGFASAIFHRGVRHVRLPTTVLAQDDSGVGVKNAINAFGAKNLLGTFAPPFAVINDTAFLDALPAREKAGGMAEAVKVGLIRDAGFFAWIEREADALARFEPAAVDVLIRQCARLHMRQIVTGGDPFERGSARPLDFGHWAAHKLESLSRHELRHGEAVAIGIALDTRYSVLAGLLLPGEDARVANVLTRLGFTLWNDAFDFRNNRRQRRVLEGLAEFQEHLGGELTITLLAAIGRGVEVHHIDPDLVEQSIRWLQTRTK
jgi:3-dehydroquinate synthase